MKSSLATACPFAMLQLVAGLMIGLTVDISAGVTVDICSESRTHVNGRTVSISSPSYPSLHSIRDNITCSCHVTTGRNSNDDIRIQPTDIAFSVSRTTCYASIDLWSSSERVDKKFCLNSPNNTFNNSVVQFKSVFMTNITYQAFRLRASSNLQGKFLISVRAFRATNLLLICTSFPATTSAATQSISSTRISRTSRPKTTISSTIRSTSVVTRTTLTRGTTPSISTKPISSTVPLISTHKSTISGTSSVSSTTFPSHTTSITSTIPFSSANSISSTYPFSSDSPISATIPFRSVTPISTTIPFSSVTPISSTIPFSSVISISSTIPFSSVIPISSTIPFSSDTPISSSNPSNGIIGHSSTKTTRDTGRTSGADSSTMDITTTVSESPKIDAWHSTEVFTAITVSENDPLLWILIGAMVPIALIALIATTVIVCRCRRSKKQSVDVIVTGNYWERHRAGSLSILLNNTYELRSRLEGCTEDHLTVDECQEGSPSTSGQQNGQTTDGQTSNYTPMNQNGSRTFSKTSQLSSSVYADIAEIENQHASVFHASPAVGAETRDHVYYNTARDPSNTRLVRRSDASAYETCYSPEIEGATSLHLMGLNTPVYDAYTSIDECATGVSELRVPTGSQRGTDEDDYCNVVGQRGKGPMSRASGADVTLVENQIYSSATLY